MLLLRKKLLPAEMGSTEGDTHPLLWAPGYYVVHELWPVLVQVQASLAPAVSLQDGRAATALAKLLAPVNISLAICFPLSASREPG